MGAFGAMRILATRLSKKLMGGGDRRRTKHAELAPSWAPYFSRKTSFLPFKGKGRSKTEQKKRSAQGKELKPENESSFKEEEREKECGVWQRTILMGEKCDPLAFSGVIYYDRHGRRQSGVPPRSPLRSPLLIFSNPTMLLFSPTRGSN